MKQFESFDIGTVRAKEGKIKSSEQDRMKAWLKELSSETNNDLQAIGTGGNIVKLNQISGTKSHEFNNTKKLISTLKMIKPMTEHEMVYDLKLNPDRAQVIRFAGDIIIDILKSCEIQEIMAPNVGLKDGIIQKLWSKYYKTK